MLGARRPGNGRGDDPRWRYPEPKPFDFIVEYARAQRLELREGLIVPIVSLEALLTMKREAGRPQDLADIDALLEIAEHGR